MASISSEVIKRVNALFPTLGMPITFLSRGTAKRVFTRALFTNDEEETMNDAETGHLLARTRTLFVMGNIGIVPVAGDTVIDKNERISALPDDDVTSINGYEYSVNKVERLDVQGKTVAYKLTIIG